MMIVAPTMQELVTKTHPCANCGGPIRLLGNLLWLLVLWSQALVIKDLPKATRNENVGDYILPQWSLRCPEMCSAQPTMEAQDAS